ncbi:Cytochrome c, class I [Candidatus Sulfopaludibacter sp. SbA3]|nr:Cytochrome c, class I [Candidatus Sulfopaludibacter sp. SbA3]
MIQTRPGKTLLLVLYSALLLAAQGPPQTPPAGAPGGRGGRGGGFGAAFPQHPPADPAVVDRGKALYGVHCNFCHGSDARGGEGGPNLLRSDLVLNDKNGELIAAVVQNGKGEMPRLSLSYEQVSDIAAYIHSFRVGGYDVSRMVPPSVLVGDSTAGEAVFKTKCASCHSATGDLKGIASKITDPKILQNGFLMPGGGGRGGLGGRGGSPFNVPPATVTVTLATGQKVTGRLIRIDDFIVTLTDSDEAQRTFRRDGDVPKVEVHDPLQPHKELLPTYTDKQIHDLTSYLVTLK